jgi:hypothetical protein
MAIRSLSSLFILATFALPSFAEPPRERYAAALELLKQAETAATTALNTSDFPKSPQGTQAVATIRFAREAAEKATSDLLNGGDARKNALSAADTANLGATYAAAAGAAETNGDSKANWMTAAEKARQAALLLNKNVDK